MSMICASVRFIILMLEALLELSSLSTSAMSENRDFVDDGREGNLEWIAVDKLDNYDLVEDLPLILPKILGMTETAPPYSVHVSYDENDDIQMRFVTG